MQLEENHNLFQLSPFNVSKYISILGTPLLNLFNLLQRDDPLNINFIPIDVDMGNHDDLPDLLLHPSNLRLVQKFVREWQR